MTAQKNMPGKAGFSNKAGVLTELALGIASYKYFKVKIPRTSFQKILAILYLHMQFKYYRSICFSSFISVLP